MTDEERQKLCESLRLAFSPWPCRIAADEIERLVARVKELELALDKIEAVCRHGPHNPDDRWIMDGYDELKRSCEEKNKRLWTALPDGITEVKNETCSGQRGIYQEVQMTDEERQKLCAALRNTSDDWLPERLRTDVRDIAADEIERLAKEVKDAKELIIVLLNKAKEYMD
jgi:HAMP domain-containing protein